MSNGSHSIPAADQRPCRANRSAFRVIGGEGLLMVIDRHELHRLNSVGTRVFELCDGVATVDGIADAIAREFEVDLATARADVQRFLSELSAAGAIGFGEPA